MLRLISCALMVTALWGMVPTPADAELYTRAFGQSWGSLSPQDWERFYHYPYVYYPHNFWSNGYFRSSDSLYYRYPAEMRIPVYNKKWHNYYPECRPYHKGHHFVLDVF